MINYLINIVIIWNDAERKVEQNESSFIAWIRGRNPRRIYVYQKLCREALYSHQKNCEKTGKYMEAETAKRRLVKVKE